MESIDDSIWILAFLIILPILVFMDNRKWRRGKDGYLLPVYGLYVNVLFYGLIGYSIFNNVDNLSFEKFIVVFDYLRNKGMLIPVTVLTVLSTAISSFGTIKRIKSALLDRNVELELFDKPYMCFDSLNDSFACNQCEIVCNSRKIFEKIIQNVTLNIRDGKNVYINFHNVSSVDELWIYRLYVSVYRGLKIDENIDERLIVKHLPYPMKLNIEDVKCKAYKHVWGDVGGIWLKLRMLKYKLWVDISIKIYN